MMNALYFILSSEVHAVTVRFFHFNVIINNSENFLLCFWLLPIVKFPRKVRVSKLIKTLFLLRKKTPNDADKISEETFFSLHLNLFCNG